VASDRRAGGRRSLRGREAGWCGDSTATDDGDDDLSKRGAAEAVNDEVNGRVGDNEQVADALVEEERTRAGLGVLAEQDDEQLSDEGRSLTDDEDQHDNDQHPSDVVLRAAAVSRRYTVLFTTSGGRRPGTAVMTTMVVTVTMTVMVTVMMMMEK